MGNSFRGNLHSIFDYLQSTLQYKVYMDNKFRRESYHNIKSHQPDTAERSQDDDNQWRCTPRGQQNEAGQCNSEIGGSLDRTGPKRIVECCTEQSHDRGVDPMHRGPRRRALSKRIPEGQRTQQSRPSAAP